MHTLSSILVYNLYLGVTLTIAINVPTTIPISKPKTAIKIVLVRPLVTNCWKLSLLIDSQNTFHLFDHVTVSLYLH